MLRLALALATTLALPPAPCHAAGVTLVTHGFNGNVTDWVIPLLQRIGDHPGMPDADATYYALDLDSRRGPATAVALGGVPPLAAASGEILIALDWSAIAGFFQASTTEVAQAAFAALTDPQRFADTGGRPLAELPLHLVGHSRGASVVTELARLLGRQGIWVDQVTTLDPYPVSLFGDAAVNAWSNILFADNYWQRLAEGDPLTGQPLTGAYNRELLTLPGGYPSSHSDVHLWYHGTIDLATPADDTQAMIQEAERANWWTAGESLGATTGFHFSRLGGGNRLADAELAGPGTGQVRAGFNGHWDLGAGLRSNRIPLASNTGQWPSLIRCLLASPPAVPAGTTIQLDLHHQSGAAASGQATLSILLDPDANPWNGNELAVATHLLAHTGPAAVARTLVDAATGGAPPGRYHVAARITDGTRSRTAYADTALEVLPAPPPRIAAASLRLDAGRCRFTVHATPGQAVTIQSSPDLNRWTDLGTLTLDTATWDFTDPRTPPPPAAFYRAVPAP